MKKSPIFYRFLETINNNYRCDYSGITDKIQKYFLLTATAREQLSPGGRDKVQEDAKPTATVNAVPTAPASMWLFTTFNGLPVTSLMI